MKKLNVALIGAGILGLRRVRLFAKKYKLIACADTNINKLKKNFNDKKIFLTNNWKDILNIRNLDAVFIATYHSIQPKIIEKFGEKNINIFCEKPGGTVHSEILKLIKKFRKKNIIIKFGYNHRYHPSFILAKSMLKKNLIGKILYIRAVYGHGGRKNYHKEWRFKKKLSGGGELIDKGSHLIDLCRFFLGELILHSSYKRNFFWNTNLEDNCFFTLKNRKKQLCFLHASSTEWKNKFLFEIFCKYGKIEISGLGKSYGKEQLFFYKMSRNMGIPKKKVFSFSLKDINNTWKLELDDFYNSIKKLKKCTPGLEDVYQNLKIINKIYKNDNC